MHTATNATNLIAGSGKYKTAFILTLNHENHPRNAAIAAFLERHGWRSVFVIGTRGAELAAAEYFDLVLPYAIARGRIMTPGEVGCALGHRRIYELFLSTNLDAAVVLEDDAMLDEVGMARLSALLELPVHSAQYINIVGMEGMEPEKPMIAARLLDSALELWEISRTDTGWIFGTCGYLLSRPLANRLLTLADRGVFVVDDFPYLLREGAFDRLLWCYCVGHPRAIGSTIEKSRAKIADLYIGKRAKPWTKFFLELRQTNLYRPMLSRVYSLLFFRQKLMWRSRFGG